MHIALVHPRQHSAELLRVAAEPVGLAVPTDPLAGIVKPVQWHRATVGRRPSFLSVGDARAFEAGWHRYPKPHVFPPNTPFAKGWASAETHAPEAA